LPIQTTKKLRWFFFLLSHTIPTKQKNSIKQDLSLFYVVQQQNKKINEVLLHPIIVATKKKELLFVS
jgi:F0F1-type ATP synthase delta subunit